MGKSWDWHWNSTGSRTRSSRKKKKRRVFLLVRGDPDARIWNKFLPSPAFRFDPPPPPTPTPRNFLDESWMHEVAHTAGFHSTLWLPPPIARSAVVAHPLFWESRRKAPSKKKRKKILAHFFNFFFLLSDKWGYICWVSGLTWRVEEVGMDWGSCWYSYWIYWGRRPAIWSPSTGIPWTKGKRAFFLFCFSCSAHRTLLCRFELGSFPGEG